MKEMTAEQYDKEYGLKDGIHVRLTGEELQQIIDQHEDEAKAEGLCVYGIEDFINDHYEFLMNEWREENLEDDEIRRRNADFESNVPSESSLYGI